MNLELIYSILPTSTECVQLIEKLKWPHGIRCSYCNGTKFSPIAGKGRFHCNSCNSSFSVTTGTIFQKSKVDLQKWFVACYVLQEERRVYTSRELGALLSVTKDTAHGIMVRIQHTDSNQKEFIKNLNIAIRDLLHKYN